MVPCFQSGDKRLDESWDETPVRSVPNISVLCLRDYVEPETVLKAEMPACIASLVLACLRFYTLCLARDRAGPSR